MYFREPNGNLYIPDNHGEVYRGDVPVRDALALSLNIPAVEVLQMLHFDEAIAMASRLLGVRDPDEISRIFPRSWALALGTVGVSPLGMARAYSAFANGGRGVEPAAVLCVRDSNGRIIADPESERAESAQFGDGMPRLMKPQTAYLVTDILQSAVSYGTVAAARFSLGGIRYPLAGKTGTSQNWHNAWTVGYSPYFVTAVWFGFDRGGGSLGTSRSGALLASPVWGQFMHDIHATLDRDRVLLAAAQRDLERSAGGAGGGIAVSREDLSRHLDIPPSWISVISEERAFERPPGLVEYTVCVKSGLRPSAYCAREDRRRELFFPDNVPEEECTICRDELLKSLEAPPETIDGRIDTNAIDRSLLQLPDAMPEDIDDF
ncbi:hypothetical protein JW777_02805, partial [bacterium]|nr:hypothetical protein [bacterium]